MGCVCYRRAFGCAAQPVAFPQGGVSRAALLIAVHFLTTTSSIFLWMRAAKRSFIGGTPISNSSAKKETSWINPHFSFILFVSRVNSYGTYNSTSATTPALHSKTPDPRDKNPVVANASLLLDSTLFSPKNAQEANGALTTMFSKRSQHTYDHETSQIA